MAKRFHEKYMNDTINSLIDARHESYRVEIAKLKLEVKQLKNEIVNVRLGNSERWAAIETKYRQARELIEKFGM
jgi:sensor histidine kinase YesM